VLVDFKRALARVQSDFGFYVDCQANPALALAGYDLTEDERGALIDPEKLAAVFKPGAGILNLRPSITIKISGTHDWINRAVPVDAAMESADRDARIATEVAAIRQAGTEVERTEATVRLMGVIG